MVNGVTRTLTLHDAMYVRESMYKLISILVACRKELKIIINDDHNDPESGKLKLYHKPSPQEKILRVETKEVLYQALLRVVEMREHTHLTKRGADNIWHHCLGHCSESGLGISLAQLRNK